MTFECLRSAVLKLSGCVVCGSSVPAETDVLSLPGIRETEILDDIVPETVDHPQTADLPLPVSPPATVSLEDVTLETGTEEEALAAPGTAALNAQALRSALGRQQSESPSQASVDEEIVPITDIYFVSSAPYVLVCTMIKMRL